MALLASVSRHQEISPKDTWCPKALKANKAFGEVETFFLIRKFLDEKVILDLIMRQVKFGILFHNLGIFWYFIDD